MKGMKFRWFALIMVGFWAVFIAIGWIVAPPHFPPLPPIHIEYWSFLIPVIILISFLALIVWALDEM